MARGDSESFRVRSAHQYAKIESEIMSWCEKSAEIYPNSMEHMIAGGSRALIISSARTTIKRQKKKTPQPYVTRARSDEYKTPRKRTQKYYYILI